MGILGFIENKLLSSVNSEEKCFELAYDLIAKQKLDKAYKIICNWNVKSKAKSLGFNWDRACEKGLSINELRLYKELYNLCNSLGSSEVFAGIFMVMSGYSTWNVMKLMQGAGIPCDDKTNEKLHYVEALYSSYNDIADMKRYDTKYYIFMSTLDEFTCPICGKLDGKRLKVEDAQIGINFPPMHLGCRCTTVDGTTLKALKETKRRYRNPTTGKNEVGPYITYNQWKKMMYK